MHPTLTAPSLTAPSLKAPSLAALSLSLLCALPFPALAQDATGQSAGESAAGSELLGAEAFDSYTRGKTLSFSWQGQEFGKEQYLPDRRVIWAFSGEECRRGSWYPAGDHICFIYDDDPMPKCWTFRLGPTGLQAMFEDGTQGADLTEVEQSPEPLSCPGPDVGV